MKKHVAIFMALILFSEFVVTRPETITISAGANVRSGSRLALEWLHRVGQGVYVYSSIYYINFQNQINVPRSFQSNSNFSMQGYETEGFRLTLDADVSKRAHVLFPFNDNKNINYKFKFVGAIVERDSDSDDLDS